jgi:hypothetical protein
MSSKFNIILLYMQTACKDVIQTRIKDEIQKREKILSETYNNLKANAKDNDFLQSVLNDYENYYSYIRAEKEKQYLAFKNIADYLDKLIMNTDILKEKGEMLIKDKNDILAKITDIKKELADITQE